VRPIPTRAVEIQANSSAPTILREKSSKFARKKLFTITLKFRQVCDIIYNWNFGKERQGMNIGNITLKHGLCLAPMAGATDRTFRAICREHGAEYTVSEMISAKALCYDQLSKKTVMPSASAQLATIYESEMPIAIQLFGSEPDLMARAAEMIVDRAYRGCVSEISPAAIDINMGCPMKKIVSNGEGSALMRSPQLAADIVRAVKKAVSVPVTVKIRAGWTVSPHPNLQNA
jgi:tRNA-dihydrouridine synthase